MSSKGIGDVNPSLTELAFIIVAHRHVNRILVLNLLLALLETLVLKVEAVFEKTLLEKLGDVVESHMYQDSPEDCGCHIQPDVQTKGNKHGHNPMAEEPQRENGDEQSGHDGIENLLAGVELQMLLVASADTGDADEKQSRQL